MSSTKLNTEISNTVSNRLIAAANRSNTISKKINSSNQLSIFEKMELSTICDANKTVLSKLANELTSTANEYERLEKFLQFAAEHDHNILELLDFDNIFHDDADSDTTFFDAIQAFLKNKKGAFNEFYNLLRDGKLDALTVLEWISKNFFEDESLQKLLFGDNYDSDNGIVKIGSTLYTIFNDAVEFFSDVSSILDDTSIEGLDVLSKVFSIFNVVSAPYDLSAGTAAILMGLYNGDTQLAVAGTEYIDNGLSSISDVVMAFAPVGGIYGYLIGLGVDCEINRTTNRLESIIRGDSIWETFVNTEIKAPVETINDNIFGNFICQAIFYQKTEKPFKNFTNWYFDGAEAITGIDCRDYIEEYFPPLDYLLNTDNWLGQLNKAIGGWVE